MTPGFVAQQPTGSTASTNAKAALGLTLVKWTAILVGVAFLFAVATEAYSFAQFMAGTWFAFMAAYLGINTYQHNSDRETDYGALQIKAGIPAPTVTKEKTVTTSQATTEKNTTAPAVEVPPEMGGGG